MRPFLVGDAKEGAEAALLSLKALCGWTSSVGFQRSMQPLIAPVLVRTGGFDEFMPDREVEPVHGQLREESDGGRC